MPSINNSNVCALRYWSWHSATRYSLYSRTKVGDPCWYLGLSATGSADISYMHHTVIIWFAHLMTISLSWDVGSKIILCWSLMWCSVGRLGQMADSWYKVVIVFSDVHDISSTFLWYCRAGWRCWKATLVAMMSCTCGCAIQMQFQNEPLLLIQPPTSATTYLQSICLWKIRCDWDS